MPTSYPSALDAFTNPAGSDFVSVVDHADQHANANDAIEAIEGALGTTAALGTGVSRLRVITNLLTGSASAAMIDAGHKTTFTSDTAGHVPVGIKMGGPAAAAGTAAALNIVDSNGTSCFLIDKYGAPVQSVGALGTGDVAGFPFIRSCAGAPTGVPSPTYAGSVPYLYDTTNNKLWFYNAGWKGVVLA